MERTTFETNRALEFFSEKELSMQIGQNRNKWPISIIKELVDNSLDACETADIIPEITIDVGDGYFSVADNGPGLPEETLRRSLDYMVRVSDKNHYVSPSRGQLGNALKCVWAAPFVASRNGHSMVEVGTNGRRYVIDVQIDAIKQEPAVTMTESKDTLVRNGCFIKIHSTELTSLLTNDSSPFSYNINRLFELMAGYSAFNPAAAFVLNFDGERYEHPAKTGSVNKWIPSDPTSVWWYDSERFKNLICAYLADEKRGGRVKPIREFIAEFNGLKGTAKHKRILADTGLSGAYLNSLVNGNGVENEVCEQLLLSMREESKPIKPAALGIIGENCLTHWISNYCSHESIRYRKRTGMVDNMPYVLEVALGIKDEEGVFLSPGLNFSHALTDPFYHLDRYLEQSLIDWEDPLVIAIHLTMPLLDFTDRGKSRLSLPDEVEKSLSDAVQYVAKEWTQLKKKKKREDRANYKEWQEREKRRRREKYSIKEAAFEVMEQAYLNASANGTLPANARQIMYAARPKVIALAGKCWKNSSYFTQTLLNEYIDLFPEKTSDWDVVYDARGKLVEPHTGERVDIGTVAVRKYVKSWTPGVFFGGTDFNYSGEADTQGPSCRYNYALFVEKEGFNELLEHDRIAERYDLAIMSTKGMSTTAARLLVDELTKQNVTILVVRDFDKAGFSIVNTLSGDTNRYQYNKPPNVIDLGLRLEDVREWELQSEETTYTSRINPKHNIISGGATEEEADYLVSDGYPGNWTGSRVELNAFLSNQLLEWLEKKLKDVGVSKVVPDQKIVKDAYIDFYKKRTIQSKVNEFIQSLDNVDVDVPGDIQDRLQEKLSKSYKPWDQVVYELAGENLKDGAP